MTTVQFGQNCDIEKSVDAETEIAEDTQKAKQHLQKKCCLCC